MPSVYSSFLCCQLNLSALLFFLLIFIWSHTLLVSLISPQLWNNHLVTVRFLKLFLSQLSFSGLCITSVPALLVFIRAPQKSRSAWLHPLFSVEDTQHSSATKVTLGMFTRLETVWPQSQWGLNNKHPRYVYSHGFDRALRVAVPVCRSANHFGPQTEIYYITAITWLSILYRHSCSLEDRSHWLWWSPDFSTSTTKCTLWFWLKCLNNYWVDLP